MIVWARYICSTNTTRASLCGMVDLPSAITKLDLARSDLSWPLAPPIAKAILAWLVSCRSLKILANSAEVRFLPVSSSVIRRWFLGMDSNNKADSC